MSADRCLFCAIVARERSAHLVTETDDTVTFLDHRPIFLGHALVVPRLHVETLRDLPADLVAPFFAEVQRVAAAVQDGLGAQGTFVAQNNVVSQSVPHFHVHVVPRRRKDGLRGFFWPRTRYEDDAAAAATAAAIRAALPDV
ncbi:MAG TPA: HIT family protein [Acidimicrobiia bacterium]|nr:HIT family protein [Acidimicrobiia bacterium]